VARAHALADKPAPKIGPFEQKSWQLGRLGKKPGRGKARALYAAGTLLGTAGAVPLGAALTNKLPARQRVAKRDAQTFVGAGYQGTRDSLKTKVRHVKTQQTSPKAYAAAAGVGAGAGALGSLAAHQGFDLHDKARALKGLKGSRLRSAGVGIAGATALTASLPVANKVLRHVSPEYKVSPYGVTRAKKAPVRPSSKASINEGRASRGADPRMFRSQVVGKSLPTHAIHPSFGKVRVLHQHSKDHFMVLTKRDDKRLVHRDMLTFTNKVSKAAPLTLKPKEQKQLAGTKRKSANLSTLGGAISLTGLGLLAAGQKSKATTLGIIGGGVGGTNSLINAKVQRHEAKALDAGVKKDFVMPYFPPKHDDRLPLHVLAKAAWGPQVPVGATKALSLRPSFIATRREAGGILRATRVKASIG
jgi:hypothetical protein